MNIKYDKEADALYIQFSENEVAFSESPTQNTVLDFDKDRILTGIEITYFISKHKNEVMKLLADIQEKLNA